MEAPEHLGDDARAAVALAWDEAERTGRRYLGTEHLLLALVRADTPARDALARHGVQEERARAQRTGSPLTCWRTWA